MNKQYVRSLFNAIAYRYDLLNHLLSGGVDFSWRRRAIKHLRHMQPRAILDVATGTADFALAARRLHPDEIVGVDIAEEMLQRGKEKIERRGLTHLITLCLAEAEQLPFDNERFDAAIVAFGARNFEDLHRGLSEMHRVLRRGGMIVVLEFSRPRVFPFKQIYFLYFRFVLPYLGRMISKHREAYTYLPDTVLTFPEGREFLDILDRIGFRDLHEERLTLGIATIYTGVKS